MLSVVILAADVDAAEAALTKYFAHVDGIALNLFCGHVNILINVYVMQ